MTSDAANGDTATANPEADRKSAVARVAGTDKSAEKAVGPAVGRTPYVAFETYGGKPTPAGDILLSWHASLSQHRGSRQVFQRGLDSEKMIRDPQYQRLRRLLSRMWIVDDDTLVRIVKCVSVIKVHAEVPFGKSLNAKKAAGRTAVSEKRLNLLLKSEAPDSLVRLVRSSLRMIKADTSVAVASVTAVADLIMHWGNPVTRKYARRDLVTSYFEHAAAETD